MAQGWVEEGGEGWVKGAMCAYAAAAAAFEGRDEDARRWLGEAQRLSASENEWRQNLMANALACGKAAVILKSSLQIGAALRDLQSWVEESQEERQRGAAWALAEWFARRADGVAASALTEDEKRAGRALLALVARAARGLVACGLGEEVKSQLDSWLGAQGIVAVPVACFRLLTCGAGICAACSDAERANGFWTLARERAGRGQTGDENAPWALLAEAAIRCGCKGAVGESLWLDGLDHAAARPGYHRRVAVALTLGSLAAQGGEQAGRESAGAISKARQVAGLESR